MSKVVKTPETRKCKTCEREYEYYPHMDGGSSTMCLNCMLLRQIRDMKPIKREGK